MVAKRRACSSSPSAGLLAKEVTLPFTCMDPHICVSTLFSRIRPFPSNFHAHLSHGAFLLSLISRLIMNLAYSSVARETITENGTTHSRLVSVFENHIKQHGASPSLPQLFDSAREEASSDHDRAVVPTACFTLLCSPNKTAV